MANQEQHQRECDQSQHMHVINMRNAENRWSDIDSKIIKSFTSYLFTVISIEKPVSIRLKQSCSSEPNDIINLKLATASLHDREIVVYCKNRGIFDILRSIAHEVVHIKQHDEGLLNGVNISFYLQDEDAEGYDIEYEAYGLSGILVRNFRAMIEYHMNNEDDDVKVYQTPVDK